MESQQAIEQLFSKTPKADVAEILGFLHTSLSAILEMAVNGRQPDLTDSRDYDSDGRRLNSQIEEFIRTLP